MKKYISTQSVRKEADVQGQNVLDKHKGQHFSHQASKSYPLMPTWRVYRISYWPTSQNSRARKEAGAIK